VTCVLIPTTARPGKTFAACHGTPKQGWCHTLFIGRDALTIPPVHPSFFA